MDGPESNRKETTSWLLKNAPKLKTVVISHSSCLKIVPQTILAKVEVVLDKDFEVLCEHVNEVQLLQVLPDKAFGFSVLHVQASPCYNFLGPGREGNEEIGDEIRDWNPLRQFWALLQRMLRNDAQNLSRIKLYDPYPLGHLAHPPLLKLSSITVDTPEDANPDCLWTAIASVNFASAMPI